MQQPINTQSKLSQSRPLTPFEQELLSRLHIAEIAISGLKKRLDRLERDEA